MTLLVLCRFPEHSLLVNRPWYQLDFAVLSRYTTDVSKENETPTFVPYRFMVKAR